MMRGRTSRARLAKIYGYINTAAKQNAFRALRDLILNLVAEGGIIRVRMALLLRPRLAFVLCCLRCRRFLVLPLCRGIVGLDFKRHQGRTGALLRRVEPGPATGMY